MKILIADPSSHFVSALHKALVANNHTVFVVKTLDDAYEKMDDQKDIDLIITPIIGLNGIKILAHKRKANHQARVWIVSASMNDGINDEVTQHGAEKGIMKNDILAELRSIGIIK